MTEMGLGFIPLPKCWPRYECLESSSGCFSPQFLALPAASAVATGALYVNRLGSGFLAAYSSVPNTALGTVPFSEASGTGEGNREGRSVIPGASTTTLKGCCSQ